MENQSSKNQESKIEKYEFLNSPEARTLFASIDYNFKGGKHIQRLYPKQEREFQFLEKYQESLDAYYWDLFGVHLVGKGGGNSRYYYLDFEESEGEKTSRGKIFQDKRKLLSEECVLIGIFFWKIVAIDHNLDLHTLAEFKRLLREEYTEYQEDFYRVLARTKNKKISNLSDQKIEDSVKRAFDEFENLNWIAYSDQEKESFEIFPSFSRLLDLYRDVIENIEERVKQL